MAKFFIFASVIAVALASPASIENSLKAKERSPRQIAVNVPMNVASQDGIQSQLNSGSQFGQNVPSTQEADVASFGQFGQAQAQLNWNEPQGQLGLTNPEMIPIPSSAQQSGPLVQVPQQAQRQVLGQSQQTRQLTSLLPWRMNRNYIIDSIPRPQVAQILRNAPLVYGSAAYGPQGSNVLASQSGWVAQATIPGVKFQGMIAPTLQGSNGFGFQSASGIASQSGVSYATPEVTTYPAVSGVTTVYVAPDGTRYASLGANGIGSQSVNGLGSQVVTEYVTSLGGYGFGPQTVNPVTIPPPSINCRQYGVVCLRPDEPSLFRAKQSNIQ